MPLLGREKESLARTVNIEVKKHYTRLYHAYRQGRDDHDNDAHLKSELDDHCEHEEAALPDVLLLASGLP
jgi:hypothetical protein